MKTKSNKKTTKVNAGFPAYKNVIPLMITIFIVLFPWIVGSKLIESDFALQGIVKDHIIDMFLYYKELALVIVAALALLWTAGENVFPDRVITDTPIRKTKKIVWILVAIFVVAVVVSAIASNHFDVTLMGMAEECEGALGLVACAVLFLVVYNNFYYKKSIKLFGLGIVAVTGLTVLLSIVEFLYKPLPMMQPFNWIINSGIADILKGPLPMEDTANRVVLGFYNSSYYGGFCCMLYPFVAEMFLRTKDIRHKILMIVLNVGLIFCVIVSKSSTALYLMIFEMLAICVIEYKIVFKRLREILIGTVSLVIFLFVMNLASGGVLLSLARVSATNGDSFLESATDKYVVSDIVMEDKKVTIKGESNEFSICYDKNISFVDGNNNPLEVKYDDKGIYEVVSEGFENVCIDMGYIDSDMEDIYIKVDLGYEGTVDFMITAGTFKGVGVNSTPVDDIGSKTNAGKQFYSAFTGRGYAWVNTLPILKDTIIIGKGPGNFEYNFKQYDYVGLLKTHGTHQVIIDRPHNMYLQYAVNIGIIGTVAMVSLMIYIVVNAVKDKFGVSKLTQDDDLRLALVKGATFSIVVFLMYSVINDGIIAVTPYVWIFMGFVMSSLQFKK